MTSTIDLVGLARQIAEIARTTTDQEAGRILVDLVKQLLDAAGLPPAADAGDGGGEPPAQWGSSQVDCAAVA